MLVSRDELVQSKIHSNSNPSLNAPSDSLSPPRNLGRRNEDWDLGLISKVPGNRSSMAESKAGHMRLPLSPVNKKVCCHFKAVLGTEMRPRQSNL